MAYCQHVETGVRTQVGAVKMLLRKACVTTSSVDAVRTAELLELPASQLALELAQLLMDTEDFEEQCVDWFTEGGATQVEAPSGVKLLMPCQRLYEVTQRVIDCLGSRDPVALGLIADIFSKTLSVCEPAGGAGQKEFCNHLRAILTQILAELREVSSSAAWREEHVPGDGLGGIIRGAVARAAAGIGLADNGTARSQDPVDRAPCQPADPLSAPQPSGVVSAEASADHGAAHGESPQLMSEASRAPAHDQQQARLAGVRQASEILHTPAQYEQRVRPGEGRHMTETVHPPAHVHPQGRPGETSHTPADMQQQNGIGASEIFHDVPRPTTWVQRTKQSLLSNIDALADRLDSVFAPDAGFADQHQEEAPRPVQTGAAEGAAQPSSLPPEAACDGHAGVQREKDSPPEVIRDSSCTAFDAGGAGAQRRALYAKEHSGSHIASSHFGPTYVNGHGGAQQYGGAHAGSSQAPPAYVNGPGLLEQHGASLAASHHQVPPPVGGQGSLAYGGSGVAPFAAQAGAAHKYPSGVSGGMETVADFRSCEAGEHCDVAFAVPLVPAAPSEIEVGAMLDGSCGGGLPTYVAHGGTWEARRLIIGGVGRHLYVLEEDQAASGVSSFAAQFENPCFELSELRQINRRSSAGWHVLSLQFEEGSLVLRFSYPELQDGLVRALISDRRVPVVDIRV